MIQTGKTYTAHNQGKTITPVTIEVTVVWADDRDVHYRIGSDALVKQTTLERFKSIVQDEN